MIPFFDKVSKREQRKPIVDAAEIVSLVLDPFLITLLTSLSLVYYTHQSGTANGWSLLGLLFLSLIAPIGYLIYGLKTGKISDIFITDRSERHTLLVIATLAALGFYFGLNYLQAPKILLAYSCSALVLAALVTAITFYWKISGHTSVLTLNILTLITVFGGGALWMVLLIPIVALSRLILKVHTLEQVLAGTLISAVIFFIVFNYFGIIQLL